MASEMPNFRNPAPEAPVRTYPTPDITDQVLVEWVTSEEAFSRPLSPGTPHANTRDFSGFKLGKQDVNPRDNHWFIRYWVVDQPNPDFYNYAIKFSQESNLHQIIIRSYREPKEGYTPRDKESPDPDFPGAILVSEEAKQFDPNSEFYADYFNVVRVYETLPGPWTTKTDIDRDGIVNVNTRRNLAANITVGEVVVTVGTDRIWRRTTKKDNDTVVTDEIVEERVVPGNVIPSAKVDQNFIVHDIDSTLKEASLITPGVSLVSGVITTRDQEPVGLLVSREVDDRYNLFLDASSSTSIRQVIPDEFLRVLPTYTFSHRLAGTITEPPVLALGELTRKEDQLDTLTFRRSTETLPVSTLPITVTNQELTEQYGGGFLTVTLTLDTTVMTPEEGYLVVESFVRELHAPDPPAYPTGLYMKLSKHLAPPETAWPPLIDHGFDSEMQIEFDVERQVMPAAYTPDTGANFVETTKAIDKWRTNRTKVTKFPDALSPETAVISYRYHPFQFPGTLDYQRLITFDHHEGFRRASALLVKHTVRTWWVESATTPTVGNTDLGSFDIDVKEIITDTVNVPVFSEGSTTGAQEYPEVLHDDITNSLGAFYAATTPTFTEYYAGIGSGTTANFGFGTWPSTGNGSGYSVNDSITACGYNFTVLGVDGTGAITFAAPDPLPPANIIFLSSTSLGACSVGGGGGSGAFLNVLEVTYDVPIPGSAWIGNERVISAIVRPTEIPGLWKVTTESVVMR